MAYVDIVTALALIQFIVFGFRVGGARSKYGVKAPAIALWGADRRCMRCHLSEHAGAISAHSQQKQSVRSAHGLDIITV
jgi:hypothetical protein